MNDCFASFKDHPNVSDVRQTGMVLAIELIKDKKRKSLTTGKKEEELKPIFMALKIMYS